MLKTSSLYFGSAALFTGISVASAMSKDPVSAAVGATGAVFFGFFGIRSAMEEITAPITAQLAKLAPQVPATQAKAVGASTPKSP